MNTVELIIVVALFAICISGVLSISVLTQEVYIKNEIAFDIFDRAVIDQAHIEDSVISSFENVDFPAFVHNLTPCIENVTFDYSTGTYHVLSINRLFFDTKRDLGLGGDCLGYPSAPSSLEELDTLHINNTVLSDIDIVGDKAIVSANSESTTSPDVYSVSIGEELMVVNSVDSGEGINVVDVTGEFVFAGARQSTEQFQVFYINDDSLDLVATSSLPSVTGSWPEATSIFYENEKVYIGTHRTAGREFHIYDVSDPYHPVWLGYKEVNHNINDIVVRDGIAYLATSGNVRDVIVLNVENPTNITQLAALDIAGNEDGRRLFLTGDILYLGRFKALTPSGKDLYKIKIDKADPTHYETVYSARIGADINQIIYIQNTLLIGSNAGNVPLFPFGNISAFDIQNNFIASIYGEGDLMLFEIQ